MSDYKTLYSFQSIKDAMCKNFCICDLNCRWCILRKLTPETAGEYKLKDLIYKPKNPLYRGRK